MTSFSCKSVIVLTGFSAVVHVECTSTDECKQWVNDFAVKSRCTWRVRRTYPDGRRGLVCRFDYVCQHGSFGKSHMKHRRTKDTDCSARLSIKVMQNWLLWSLLAFSQHHCNYEFDSRLNSVVVQRQGFKKPGFLKKKTQPAGDNRGRDTDSWQSPKIMVQGEWVSRV